MIDEGSAVGPLVRQVAVELGAAGERCYLLAAYSGLDATAIWEWGYLERVSSGLYLLQLGAQAQAKAFLDTAELLLPGLAAARPEQPA